MTTHTHSAHCGIPAELELTAKQRAAVDRLLEYKAIIKGHVDPEDGRGAMRIAVPMELRAEQYVEIGYLIAQISRDDFPTHYSRFGFSTDLWQGCEDPTVRFGDVVPPGYYRIWIRVE